MSVADMNAVITRVAVRGANGSPPPGNWSQLTGMEWSNWFADEFNRFRGLNNGARESVLSPERFTAELTLAELSRQAGKHQDESLKRLRELELSAANRLAEFRKEVKIWLLTGFISLPILLGLLVILVR